MGQPQLGGLQYRNSRDLDDGDKYLRIYGVNNRSAEVGPGRLADPSRSAVHLRAVYNVYTIVYTAYRSQ
jgi:hypothetical protein